MREPAFCPTCRQPIRNERCGVSMSPLKAAIVDAIRAAGDLGISAAEIAASDIYRDRRRVSQTTIVAHVFQIRDLLEPTDWRIATEGGRRYGRWFLVRRRNVRRAA